MGLAVFLVGVAVGGGIGFVITNFFNKKKIQVVSKNTGSAVEEDTEENKEEKLEG